MQEINIIGRNVPSTGGITYLQADALLSAPYDFAGTGIGKTQHDLERSFRFFYSGLPRDFTCSRQKNDGNRLFLRRLVTRCGNARKQAKTGIAKKIFIRAVVTVIHASISLSRIKGKMKTSGIHSLCRRMGTVAAQHSVPAKPPSGHVVKPGSRCRKTSPPG